MTNERERQRQNVRRRPGNTSPTGEVSKGSHDNIDPASQGRSNTKTDTSMTKSFGGGSKVFAGLSLAIAVAAVAVFSFIGVGGGSGIDAVSPSEEQSRLAAHQTLLASPGLPVKLVGADEVDDALAAMPDTVTTETREEMRQQISQGSLQLAWVTLWDTHVEDGDILRFESATSFPIEVMALNAKTTFAIPYPADGQVLVTGVKDGGGGITIALESEAASIAWPTMAPGDQLLLPITPTF